MVDRRGRVRFQKRRESFVESGRKEVEGQLANEDWRFVVWREQERERRTAYGRGGNAQESDRVEAKGSSAVGDWLSHRDSPLLHSRRLDGCESIGTAERGRWASREREISWRSC